MTGRGWVIEHGASEPSWPCYWAGRHGWSYDNLLAVRFARKDDAEEADAWMVSAGFPHAPFQPSRICEHEWSRALTEPLTGGEAQADDGCWIDWPGGFSGPIDSNAVEVRQRNGNVSTQYVHNINWKHELGPFDIIGYKLPKATRIASDAATIEKLREALEMIVHTFTEDSHGNMKCLPASDYQDMARAALATGAKT